MHRWRVIVNPAAGNGKGKKDWNKISAYLQDKQIDFEVKFSKYQNDSISIAKEAAMLGIRKIIVVGGDGTLNEVLNGIILANVCRTDEFTLALIPVGTGNDWGRMFSIPMNYKKAIDIICQDKTMLHDIGLIKFCESDEQKERYFINIAGAGFESKVIRMSNNYMEKGYKSKFIYLYCLLMSLLKYKNVRMNFKVDDKEISETVFSVNIGNGRYCGNGMMQTPEAVPNDGLLDITVIKNMKKTAILSNLKMLYNGTILKHPMIDGYKCKKLTINSEAEVYIEADGESLGSVPAEFSIIPSAVNIVYETNIIQ